MTRAAWLLVGVLGGLAVPAVASAQYVPTPRDDRPYHGVFGGGYGSTDQLLTLGLPFAGGRDTNVLNGTFDTGSPEATSSPQRISTNFGQANGTLAYSLAHKRFSMNAFGTASDVYYPTLPNKMTPYYNAGAGATLKVGRAGALTFGETISYQPFYYLTPFPSLGDGGFGTPILPDIGSTVQSTDYLQQMTNVAFSTMVTSKLTFRADYFGQWTTSDQHDRDLTEQAAGVHFGYGITQHLSVLIGYARAEYTTRDLDDTQRTSGDTIDGGVRYGRSLSLTRRLSFEFNTGVTGLRDRDGSHYTVVGHASLIREIGRTWSASLSYDRNFSFIAAFQQPVQSDGVSAGVGGLVSRRLQFGSAVGYTRGNIGINTANNGFTAEFASTSLTYGLSQTLGVGASYTYYRTHFGAGVVLPSGVFDQAGRQTGRVYLTVWVPLLSTKARPNAPR